MIARRPGLTQAERRGTIGGAAVVLEHEPPPLARQQGLTADGLPDIVSQQTDGLTRVTNTREVTHG